jgi:UDP-glucose 4-epimerase
LALIQAGYEVIVLDNLSNSSPVALQRVSRLCGQSVEFIEGDVCNRELLDRLFNKHNFDAVMHFAGVKSVAESVVNPLLYYQTNLVGSLTLVQAMAQARVFCLIFSSSATVYGEPTQMPIREDVPTGVPSNPYGRSKLMVEECLTDLAASEPRWSIAFLRYFNPVGAHSSGLIGENPNGLPNNLLPYMGQVAVGKLTSLSVYGSDYPTLDGTGVRDYIHVVDLAEGHIKALEAIEHRSGIAIWNLGTGQGHSVLQMIKAFEKSAECRIPYNIVARRAGDIAESWADTKKAQIELGWSAERGLDVMMADTWRWISNNPQGYESPDDK